MAIVKDQNPGSPFGATCQLNSTADLANLAQFLGKWAGLAMLVAPKGLPGFSFFQLSLCPHIFWVYYFSLSQCAWYVQLRSLIYFLNAL